MVRDYAGSYIDLKNKSYNRKRVNSKGFLSAARFMWKTLGFMLFITVIISVTSTFWYGMQVQLALDQIGGDTVTNKKLVDENKLLVAQRDLLLTRKNMEKAARKIGLQAPVKNQLRYP